MKLKGDLESIGVAELFKTLGEPVFKAYVDRWAPDVAATSENGLHPFQGGKQVDLLRRLARQTRLRCVQFG